jgi:hypothetical protein
MTKANPDAVIRFAVQLGKTRRLDGRTFNAAMREKFPGITPYALRKAYQDARILIAVQLVTRQDEEMT